MDNIIVFIVYFVILVLVSLPTYYFGYQHGKEKIYRCDVCGRRAATHVTCDALDITRIDGGDIYKCYKQIGGVNRYCKEHQRKSRIFKIIDDSIVLSHEL